MVVNPGCLRIVQPQNRWDGSSLGPQPGLGFDVGVGITFYRAVSITSDIEADVTRISRASGLMGTMEICVSYPATDSLLDSGSTVMYQTALPGHIELFGCS